MSMREIIETKLREALAPTHLPVVNQSHKHHASRGSEKHFRVVVVAEAFAGRPRVARHRMITRLLADELKGPLHALSLVALTAEEWKASAGDVGESPPCLGREKPARG